MKVIAGTLLLLLLPFQNGDDPTDPQYHIRVAELYGGQKDNYDKALHHWEKAWERADQLSGEERVRVLRAIAALREVVPPKKRGIKPIVWRIMGVLARSVNWQDDGMKAKYTLDTKTARAVEAGFHKAMDRLEKAGRGYLKIDRKFKQMPRDVRSLAGGDETRWLHPEQYEENNGPRWRPGEWNLVIVYLIGNDDPDNTVPMKDDVRYEPNVNGAAYLNYLWSRDYALDNGETGGREMVGFMYRVREALVGNAGYPSFMVPSLTWDGRKGDADFKGQRDGDLGDFAEHIAAVHLTGQMWLESRAKPPQGLYLKNWLLSKIFKGKRDWGFHEKHIDEDDPDVSTRGWSPFQSKTDEIDLTKKHRRRDKSAAYALTYLFSKKGEGARLYVTCDDAIKVILNGEVLFQRQDDIHDNPASVRLTLKNGWNTLLIKVACDTGRFGFSAMLTNDRGETPKGILPKLTKR